MTTISPSQCRAARALLGWSQPDLARRCGVHVQTVSNFESESNRTTLTKSSLDKIERTLDLAGIEFTSGEGVRRKERAVVEYTGHIGHVGFQWDVYNTVRSVGGEICVSNVNERDSLQWMGEAEAAKYREAMAHLEKNYRSKILLEEGDTYFAASKYAEYRWVPKKEFGGASFYVYGDKLAIITYQGDARITVIDNKAAADAYRAQFNVMWERAKIPPL